MADIIHMIATTINNSIRVKPLRKDGLFDMSSPCMSHEKKRDRFRIPFFPTAHYHKNCSYKLVQVVAVKAVESEAVGASGRETPFALSITMSLVSLALMPYCLSPFRCLLVAA